MSPSASPPPGAPAFSQDAAGQVGRRRRRVVALSPRDQQRVAQGGYPEELARADYEHDALCAAGGRDAGDGQGGPGSQAGSNDARLLADVPPHWQ